MLEQIADLVKEYGQDTVVNNSAIPNSQNNEVLAEATHSITGGLQSMLAGGGLQDILSLFTGGGGGNTQQSGGISGLLKNPAVSMMIGNLVNSLISKFNMTPAQANNVSSSLIPNVLHGLITRTTSNDPSNDAFDLNDLIGSLTGGKVATKESAGSNGFDFQGLLNQFTGGGSGNGGGGFNIQDIISQVTQGAQEHQQKQTEGGGGITDMIKGLFK